MKTICQAEKIKYDKTGNLLSNPQMFSQKPMVLLDIFCNSIMKSGSGSAVRDMLSANFMFEVL